jgi:hypothetical protein
MKRDTVINLDPEEGSSSQQGTSAYEEHAEIVKQLKSKTKPTTFASVRQRRERLKKKVKTESPQSETPPSSSQSKRFKPCNKKRRGFNQSFDERLWSIGASRNSNNQLIVHFSTQMYTIYDKWSSDYNCASTISVYQLNTETDVNAIRSYKCGHYGSSDSSPAFAKIAVSGWSMVEYEPHHHHRDRDRYDGSGCDSEFEDSGLQFNFESNSLESETELLDIDSLTQDILIKYIIALVHPSIDQGAESELKSEVNALNKTGSPDDDIWYAIWKMHSSNK